MLLFWVALGFALTGLLAGALFAAVRGLRAWRSFKAIGRRIGDQLDEISDATAKIGTHLDRASASSTRLSTALERLARARARLDVQRAALREARATLARAVPFLPPR